MFSIDATDGSARTGVLSTPHGNIATPALLLPTRRGSPLNLTPDLVLKLQPDAQAVQLDALQFLKSPDASVLQQSPNSARKFLALNDGLALVATGRDPGIYEYAGSRLATTDVAAAVSIHSGGLAVTPSEYMEVMAALQPDVMVALSDEVPADSKKERVAASVTRTLAWLRDCLALRAQTPALHQSALFAAVQGGALLPERERCARGVAELSAGAPVAGYAVCGLGTGESPEQRRQVLGAVLALLPADRPRLASSVGTPEEVLEGVAQGIDMFDMGYLAQATAGGYALTFPSPALPGSGGGGGGGGSSNIAGAAPAAPEQQPRPDGTGQAHGPAAGGTDAEGGEQGDQAGSDPSKINLWAQAYREDRRPLLPGCACFVCATHTRAYVHHLLQAHEMTAQVLLELHNTHHYLAFFGAIRGSIAAGAFQHFRQAFLERRQALLQAR